MSAAPHAEAAAPGLVTVACPACHSARSHEELTGEDPLSGDRFRLARCEECDLAYVNPRPDAEHLAAYYPADYYGARHPAFKGLLMGLRARKLGPASAGARVLDIGCGRGDFILACRRRGWEVAGIEQAQSPVMQLRETLGIQVETPAAIPSLASDSFDMVTLWHVLEHLPEPQESLAQVRRLLKPGGRVLIEVPNFGGWQARLGRSRWYHLDVPRHLLHFDRRSLGALLSAAGLRAERWSTFSLEYDTFGLAQTVLNLVCRQPNHLFQLLIGKPVGRRTSDTVVSFALLLPVGALAGLVSLVAPLAGQGGVLRVIARKPLAS